MGRLLVITLVVVACRKEESAAPERAPAKPAPQLAVADAAVAVDARPALIDLTRSIGVTMRVSSRVKNKAILPQHLADADLKTAWNSRTGELVGAWVDVAIAYATDKATIEEVRMTAGFAGQGPGGEDYFTMNPRIRKVTITADGKPVGTVALDITKRDLQPIPVHATRRVRIEVAEIEPGSKPSWREISVSELEVWGMLPPT